MKKILFIITVMIGLSSCSDWLDLTPLDMISDKGVFADQSLSDAYLKNMYSMVEFQKGGNETNFELYYNVGTIACVGAECRPMGDWQEPYGASTMLYTKSSGPASLDYFPYTQIRKANIFIDGMTTSPLPESFTSQRIAETRFLRGWNYFQMVRRFGGVPIETIVIPENAPDEIMYPKRNTEKEVYDFIISEMDEIFKVLPDKQDPANIGRPTKWAAMSLKARAALYAASIAKNGTPITDEKGYVGIPASEATKYYTISYNASDSIIKYGGFSLYEKVADKSKNFQNLFVDENSNPEVIFSQQFDAALKKGNSWDNLCTPAGFTAPWNSNFNIFLDFIDYFDYKDGTSGKLDRTKLTAAYQYDVNDVFGKRDPRFQATFFYPGTMWQNKMALFHSSTYYTDPVSQKRVENSSESTMIPGSTSVAEYASTGGWPGKAPNRNTTRTGIYLKKRCSESLNPAGSGLSNVDFYVFRLGETYLNLCEAAFYLGKTGEAVTAINKIRTRAGMPLRDASLTENQIRQERTCELAFEEHRFWDLRRWRIAVSELNNQRYKDCNISMIMIPKNISSHILTQKQHSVNSNLKITIYLSDLPD